MTPTHARLHAKADVRKHHIPDDAKLGFLVGVLCASCLSALGIGWWLFSNLAFSEPGKLACSLVVPEELRDISDPNICSSREHCELVVWTAWQAEQLEPTCPRMESKLLPIAGLAPELPRAPGLKPERVTLAKGAPPPPHSHSTLD